MVTSPPVMEQPSDQLSPLSRRHRANVAAWPWLAVAHTSLSWWTAFNAALVIIGANWVQRARQAAQDSPVHRPSNIQLYSGRAVATLYRLDTGNQMVDRRRYYLEEFISVLRLQPEDPTGTAVSSATPHSTFSSFGIECGESMLDNLFTDITHPPAFENW